MRLIQMDSRRGAPGRSTGIRVSPLKSDTLWCTSAVAGGVAESDGKSPYKYAKYLQFFSSKLLHQSVSANPYNLTRG